MGIGSNPNAPAATYEERLAEYWGRALITLDTLGILAALNSADPDHARARGTLEVVAEAPEAVLRAHVERHGGDLARLVTTLGERVPDLPSPRQSDPRQSAIFCTPPRRACWKARESRSRWC